jgi:hypothetical protein
LAKRGGLGRMNKTYKAKISFEVTRPNLGLEDMIEDGWKDEKEALESLIKEEGFIGIFDNIESNFKVEWVNEVTE